MKKFYIFLGFLLLLSGCSAPAPETTQADQTFSQEQKDKIVVLADKKPELSASLRDFYDVYNKQEFDRLAEFLAPQVRQYISLRNTTPAAIIADAKKFFADKSNIYYGLHLDSGDYKSRFETVGDNSVVEYLLNMTWDTAKAKQKSSHYEVQVVVEVTFDKNNKIISYLEKQIIKPQKISYDLAGVTMNVKESTDQYELEANYPQLTYADKELEAKVNLKIKERAEAAMKQFKTEVNELADDISPDIKSSIDIAYLDLNYNDDLVSFVFYYFWEYEGFPHWNLSYESFNYDIKADKFLTLEDLFNHDNNYQEALAGICLSRAMDNLKQTLLEFPEIPLNASAEYDNYHESCGDISNFSAFSLSPKNLTFNFGTYSLVSWANYSQSLTSMTIPYNDIYEYFDLNGPVKSYIIQALQKDGQSVIQNKRGETYYYYNYNGNNFSPLGLRLPVKGIIAPNGQKVLFVDENYSLYWINTDGSQKELLVNPEWGKPHGSIGAVSWSADSQKIYYSDYLGTEGWSGTRGYEMNPITKEKKLLKQIDSDDENGITNYVTDKYLDVYEYKFGFSYANFPVRPRTFGRNDEQIRLDMGETISGTNPPIFQAIGFESETEKDKYLFSVDIVNYLPLKYNESKAGHLEFLLEDLWGCGNQFSDLIDRKIAILKNGLKYVSIWQQEMNDGDHVVYNCLIDKRGWVLKFYAKDETADFTELEARLLKLLNTLKID